MFEAIVYSVSAGLVIGILLGGYLHYRFGVTVRRVQEALKNV